MSGTSADGVDTALVEFKGGEVLLHDFISPELPSSLKQQLIQLNQTTTLSLEQLAQLSFDLAQQFSQATQQLLTQNKLQAKDITAIGSHGQTIYHAPHIPMTLQIGHPAFIAKTTQIPTVADFRVDDMALSGQGAPFAPAFHQVIFQSDTPCFVVNIGGIANLSYLPAQCERGGKNSISQGYDTGPGNALMDEVCQQHFNVPFDDAGKLAKQGTPNQALLNQLLSHPYFALAHPKSTGRETFNLNWLNEQIALVVNHSADKLPLYPLDIISTLNRFTAITIANEIHRVMQQPNLSQSTQTPVWIVGGGAFNPHLIQSIQQHLPSCNVQSSAAKGINPNAIEAMMCAWLAKQRIEALTVPLVHVTGAQRDAVLGGLWHP
ncbi:Anhydro-N-acetylmuramic acid kinase [hydrothermal vent metagenome]|uniref:Anhydro-N-acetylmuramic acid kinase n=1 Tax=hydrothermal vent metagenome TaxID=652676 RepID=A0A3B0W6K5_9ZZZZ